MISKREKKNIEARIDLMNAVGVALKKYGFTKLGVNLVAEQAKMDKTAIYRHFNDFEELLKAYIEKQDYWLMSLKDYENKEVESFEQLTKLFFEEQIEVLYKNKELQQLILWELADGDGIAAPITVKREIYSQNILNQSRHILEKQNVNFNFIIAIILGGVYYLILHKNTGAFCELDLQKKAHKDELIKTINWLIDILFRQTKHNSIEQIVINSYKKGLAVSDIAEITGLGAANVEAILSTV